jgi:hypothetical protein
VILRTQTTETGPKGSRQDMIGQPSVEAQVEADFDHARRRASLRRAIGRFWGDSKELPAFEDVRKSFGAFNRVPRRMQTVEVQKIVGSVGRQQDFDACFLPVRSSMSERWENVDRAFQRGKELPAVDLYKIGDAYFVKDGNHRISVARYQGAETIDAEVVEFRSPESSPASIPAVPPNCSGWRALLSSKLKSMISGKSAEAA